MTLTFDELLDKMNEAYEAWTMRGQVIEVPVRESEAILIIAREVKALQIQLEGR